MTWSYEYRDGDGNVQRRSGTGNPPDMFSGGGGAGVFGGGGNGGEGSRQQGERESFWGFPEQRQNTPKKDEGFFSGIKKFFGFGDDNRYLNPLIFSEDQQAPQRPPNPEEKWDDRGYSYPSKTG